MQQSQLRVGSRAQRWRGYIGFDVLEEAEGFKATEQDEQEPEIEGYANP